jgi:hypothetical protein
MNRPALARRLAQNRRRHLPQAWLASLRLAALVGAGVLLAWLLLGGPVRAEESVRAIEVANAAEPETTGALPRTAPSERTLGGFYNRVQAGAILVRGSAPTRCVPSDLKAVVADVSAKFGAVSIESTHRPRSVNRRKGGARNSLHIGCRAIDFRVKGRSRGVMAYLASRPDVGGLKMYRNGIIHIDNGERRRW